MTGASGRRSDGDGDNDGAAAAGSGGGSSATTLLVPKTAPVATKERKTIVFGRVDGENRGANIDKLMFPVKTIEDDYFWMRDDARKDERVIKYLEEENSYTSGVMDPLKAQEKELYDELLGHVKENDTTVPYRYGDEFEYYSRTEEGKSYRIHCRRPIRDASDATTTSSTTDENSEEQIILDVNKVAEGQNFCDVQRIAVSPSHKLLAYSVDYSGYGTSISKLKLF